MLDIYYAFMRSHLFSKCVSNRTHDLRCCNVVKKLPKCQEDIIMYFRSSIAQSKLKIIFY